MSAHWQAGWRSELPELFARRWDVLVIGGGITGAGILLEASRRGLKALLVEQRDFAWGTSSRSSKLVHGGLRYLKEGRLGLMRESVREREALLRDAPGLVQAQGFAFARYAGRKPGRAGFALGLALYDAMAGRRERHDIGADEFAMLAPNAGRDSLLGGMCYTDAKTDDARLVLRVLQEAQAHGGVAVNYMAVASLLRADGMARGARLVDGIDGAGHEVRARLVVSATGAWADRLRGQSGAAPRIRPLRGSHLVLPAWRLPLSQAVGMMHPADGRPVFAFPWEGVTLVGTTDVDHGDGDGLDKEAAITRSEFDYLMAALQFQFPALGLGQGDVIATYAGVRPVIDGGAGRGATAPSKAGREHAVWLEQGLLTVTGGKLTTFRAIALDALRHAKPLLPGWRDRLEALPLFRAAPVLAPRARLGRDALARLAGRYGVHAQALLDAARDDELEPIAGTESLWAELRWAARAEAVTRLEDLLLRRTRLGLQLRDGGAASLGRIRAICQDELGWSDARWNAGQAAYLSLWNTHYSVPGLQA